jgi:hypothetical protein
MEREEFVSFQVFGEKMLADSLASFLTDRDVPFVYEDNSSGLDSSFGGTANLEYIVKLRPADFERVNAMMIEAAQSDFDHVEEDYYLLHFSTDELRDVVAHADEWSPYDNLLAQKLLADRGETLSHEEVFGLRQQRIDELSKPAPPQTAAIVAGYLFSLIGGLLGILIGWYLYANKKALPNGERVFTYRHRDRKHGLRIMVLGIGVLAGAVVYMYAAAIVLS